MIYAPDIIIALNRITSGLRPTLGPKPADGSVLPQSVNGVAYGAPLVSATGSACCTYGAMGCPCNCARKKSFNPWGHCDYRGGGRLLPDEDWPGLDWINGIGPGPYVETQFTDVFPLQGRGRLAPYGNYGEEGLYTPPLLGQNYYSQGIIR